MTKISLDTDVGKVRFQKCDNSAILSFGGTGSVADQYRGRSEYQTLKKNRKRFFCKVHCVIALLARPVAEPGYRERTDL